MGNSSLLRDFAGLHLSSRIQQMQTQDATMEACFKEWHKQPHSKVSHLTWDEVFTALIRWRTRCYGVGGGTALIPGSDLLNTAPDLNTGWKPPQKDGPFIVTVTRNVSVGTELYDSYCPSCDNLVFMSLWGIYVENNHHASNVWQKKSDCRSSTSSGGTMREVVEAALFVGSEDISLMLAQGWKAPRCKQSTLRQPQGPLRCSMARLAWESCAKEWEDHDLNRKQTFLENRQQSELSAESFLDYISRSAIRSVHPGLINGLGQVAVHLHSDGTN